MMLRGWLLILPSLLLIGGGGCYHVYSVPLQDAALPSYGPREPSAIIHGGQALARTERFASTKNQSQDPVVSIAVEDYDDADFDRHGFWQSSGNYAHVYAGNRFGSIRYLFNAPMSHPTEIEVIARLSAESSGLGKPNETSDVELFINGQSLGVRTVRPDDNHGYVYRWQMSNEDTIRNLGLRVGSTHELRFVVSQQARHQNGLCVYGAPLSADSKAGVKAITLSFNSPKAR